MHSSVVVAAKFCELAEEEASKSRKSSDMTVGKLFKFIWIAHGFSLALFDKPLISATIEAWGPYPVIPELYRRIRKNYNTKKVVLRVDLDEVTYSDLCSLSDVDLSTVCNTFKNYNKYTSAELSRVIRDPASPWYKIYSNIKEVNSIVIGDEDTKKYFEDLLGRMRYNNIISNNDSF